jgi:hypothetical protein
MKEAERTIIGGLVTLLLVLWLGFEFHTSPRFAGSLAGGVFAVTGSLLMLVPLVYLVIKRIKPLKALITAHVSMPTLLAIHIYAGVLGPILAMLHTGHKFESHLGIALTAMMLLVVASGFVGRYLMRMESQEIQEKQKWVAELTVAFQRIQEEIKLHPTAAVELASRRGLFGRRAARPSAGQDAAAIATIPLTKRALHLSESIADVEYAIRAHETFKRVFRAWLKLHIVLSFTLYLLLGLHIWTAIHFGLRWFS